MHCRICLALLAFTLASCSPSSSPKRSDALAELIDPEFTKEVLKSKEPVLVDFWIEGCPPCRIAAPIIEELATASDGKWKLAKVNGNDSPGLTEHYEIEGFPTFIVFKNGKEHRRMVGIPEEKTEEAIKAAFAAWIKKATQ